MKTLKESLFDQDMDINAAEIEEVMIRKWIDDNYYINSISIKIDMKKHIVHTSGCVVSGTNKKMSRLLPEGWKFDSCTMFMLKDMDIESLEGAPSMCSSCRITNCNKLTDLRGCPVEMDSLMCLNCKNLKSLKGISGNISGVDISNCPIDSLEDLPKKYKYLYLRLNNCNISSLRGLNNKLNSLIIKKCPIKNLKYIPLVRKHIAIIDCEDLSDITDVVLPPDVMSVENCNIKTLDGVNALHQIEIFNCPYIESFKGLPDVLKCDLTISNCDDLKSTDGFPGVVFGEVDINNCGLDYSDTEKFSKYKIKGGIRISH